ncbi:MAG: hypothetical protein RBS82_04455 [Syntrophales bacterium]|nr:hypothetical protein [Syntrophales bacterium]
MKLYEIIIKPLSGFGTPLKGDTIFGHFCWQAAYDDSLLNGGLDEWIACYKERPFAVFSSAWPKIEDSGTFFYAVKRPDIPLSAIFPSHETDRKKRFEELKENKTKKWMLIDHNLSFTLDYVEYLKEGELAEKAFNQATNTMKKTMWGESRQRFYANFEQQHNTINRLTMTTGEDMFAPFTEGAFSYYPETELAIFALVDEDATDIDRLCNAFERIGQFGFGKDASTGSGQFTLGDCDEVPVPSCERANACYALAPTVPEPQKFFDAYFTPFVRFGKHGDILAKSRNPFKNPVIMADEGAVFLTNEESVFDKPYIGRAVLNVSLSLPQTVVQGYAPYIPFRLEIDT